MAARDAKGRTVAGSTSCARCAGIAVRAEGVYLELVAKGRTICVGCGRFQIHCTCRP